jgi:hypothetical protein
MAKLWNSKKCKPRAFMLPLYLLRKRGYTKLLGKPVSYRTDITVWMQLLP